MLSIPFLKKKILWYTCTTKIDKASLQKLEKKIVRTQVVRQKVNLNVNVFCIYVFQIYASIFSPSSVLLSWAKKKK